MDIHMAGEVNGIEATRHILSASPHIGIVVLTMLEDDESVFAAMRAGARGYVLKGADPRDLLHAIRTVAAGGVVFSPTSAQQLLRYFIDERRCKHGKRRHTCSRS
jgi:DNA-binding NarL/FixJ family response regulator